MYLTREKAKYENRTFGRNTHRYDLDTPWRIPPNGLGSFAVMGNKGSK